MSTTIVCTINSKPIIPVDSNRHIRRIGKLMKIYNREYYKDTNSNFDTVVGKMGYENSHIIWHMREILSLGYFELVFGDRQYKIILLLVELANQLGLQLGFAHSAVINKIFSEKKHKLNYHTCCQILEVQLGYDVFKENYEPAELERKIEDTGLSFFIQYFEEPNSRDFFETFINSENSYKIFGLQQIKKILVNPLDVSNPTHFTCFNLTPENKHDFIFVIDYLKKLKAKNQMAEVGINRVFSDTQYYKKFLIVIKLMEYLNAEKKDELLMRELFALDLNLLQYFLEPITNYLKTIITDYNLPLQSDDILTCLNKINLGNEYAQDVTRMDIVLTNYPDLFTSIVDTINHNKITSNKIIDLLTSERRIGNDNNQPKLLVIASLKPEYIFTTYKILYDQRPFDTNNIVMREDTREKFNKFLGIGQGLYTKSAIKQKNN